MCGSISYTVPLGDGHRHSGMLATGRSAICLVDNGKQLCKYPMNDKTFLTEQEKFWAGKEFGLDYIARNKGDSLLKSNIHFFQRALRQTNKINTCIEFGANIGMNLKALKQLNPEMQQTGIEINEQAANQLGKLIGEANVYNVSIQEWQCKKPADLCLVKGVLIHIAPQSLREVYTTLYESSQKYILICEYYNPTPIMVPYRNHENRLFKRDFAGEMLDQYPDLNLSDYGFAYHRDKVCPQDDITWFLLEK